MRCKSAACRWRPSREGDGEVEFQEVFADDIPSDGENAADGFEEEADGDDDDVVEDDVGQVADAKVLANLFPFAYPVSLHLVVLGALRATAMSHLFLLTRSSHPGLQVAARECGLEVVVLMDGPSASQKSRGQGHRSHAQRPRLGTKRISSETTG